MKRLWLVSSTRQVRIPLANAPVSMPMRFRLICGRSAIEWPWTTIFYTARWDMGPGETCSIPTKWMSEDTLHMLFSGEDSFSVRKAEIRWR